MATTRSTLEVPFDSEIVGENGKMTWPWVDFFSRIAERLKDIETVASNMESLATSTDGHPTATDIANDWESLRADLLNL